MSAKAGEKKTPLCHSLIWCVLIGEERFIRTIKLLENKSIQRPEIRIIGNLKNQSGDDPMSLRKAIEGDEGSGNSKKGFCIGWLLLKCFFKGEYRFFMTPKRLEDHTPLSKNRGGRIAGTGQLFIEGKCLAHPFQENKRIGSLSKQDWIVREGQEGTPV
jgi:hypothetical protein